MSDVDEYVDQDAADWVRQKYHADDDGEQTLPDLCQQFGCSEWASTWCPLCRAYFCKAHDQLTPIRRHDCLRGRAEA